MDNSQNIISFCTGYGGIELGIKRTGLNVRTVAYVEIEAFATANLVAKIEQGQMDAAPIWTNLKTFDGRPFRDKVHGIIGGYPCQPFSNAGQRKGTEDPRHLFPYLCEHIRTIRPLWCFFENVGGHLSLGFDEVYKSLRDLGYQVEAGLFTAAEIGSPHKRERLFILAYTPGIRTLRRPSPIQCEDGRSRGALLWESVSTGKELGYAECNGLNRQTIPVQPRRQDEESAVLTGPSIELANSNMQPDGQNAGGNGETDSIQGIDRTALCGGRSTGAGEQLADPDAEGMERCEKSRSTESGGQSGHKQFIGQDRWPARPGQQQHEWEEPRTIKSCMGRTANGAKSRVDELRLLGNGVVPQTAEIAFRTLWNSILTPATPGKGE